jgi:hypothetical protein
VTGLYTTQHLGIVFPAYNSSSSGKKILTGMSQAVAIPVPDCFPDCLMNAYVLGYSTSRTLSEVTPLVA